MHNAIGQFSRLRLAIAPGVPSSKLSALLALQRAEEPDVTLAFFEVSDDDLREGLHESRYDAGLSVQGSSDAALKIQPLWIEEMAVAVPPRFPLLDQATLTIADLLDYSLYRWQAEICSKLDERLSNLLPTGRQNIQYVTSFGLLATWVAAGYGVGVSSQSRIAHAHRWGITMRPLIDGPYEIVTHLQRPKEETSSVVDRFERRALQVARTGAA
ncbi:LysR family transcriptional regulator [Pseudomonas indoloxydans]|uniref:LysR family transcriptional regulator n=2 Tax=Gammaproteobacteria TaxID=1236 RepID=A0A748V002_SALER|nr:substrate-binding domain-containing protein [Pseudomonas indoloxydans]EBQ9895318.1 LysR family transcriptional regulator [Salmonella enterica subsp. enterica serovar Derby]HAF5356852.1 LysR family transcriptional regulator [Salmonella enterica]HCF8557069.1 substrate-binding domain-containing protein [Klebsiella pneumoniae]ECD9035971.1 LysR family transcriptional regulator [Salmonella enterica subsp. enterica serovar Derby]PTU80086.1 LysR family transcriptional regulator [Pseudomonas indolox